MVLDPSSTKNNLPDHVGRIDADERQFISELS